MDSELMLIFTECQSRYLSRLPESSCFRPFSIMRSDVVDGLLVAEILQRDLDDIFNANEAEKMQIEEVLAASARTARVIPNLTSVREYNETTLDHDIALQLVAADARRVSDSAYAESLQLDQDAAFVANQQEAQRVVASDKKLMLDAAFARRLQELLDSDEIELDERQDIDRYSITSLMKNIGVVFTRSTVF